MSKTIARVNMFGSNGEVVRTGVDAGGYDFLYEVSGTKSPVYNTGDRVELPDGRVFYYGYSGAACYSGLGVAFYNADPKISGTTCAAAQAIGSRVVTIASQTLAVDALKGGYVFLAPAGTTAQTRRIIGNTVCSSSTVTIYLDAPLDQAITTSTFIEVSYNPFSDLRSGNMGGTASWAGVAAAYVSAASKYFWVQTYGWAWCSPQAAVQASAYVRSVYWRHDGSLDVHPAVATKDYVTDQCAGFVIGRGATQGPPLVFLTGAR
jgi:hypothetical protein